MDGHPTLPRLIGAALLGSDGACAGRIVDLMLDATRRPGWVVLRRHDDAYTLAPAEPLRWAAGRARSAHPTALLTSAAVRLRPGVLPTLEDVLAAHRHFAVLGPAGPPVSYLRAAPHRTLRAA